MYKPAFILTTIKSDEDGNAKIDLPFQIYHQTITMDGICHYCYLNNSMIDREVMVYIHYDEKDEEVVKKYGGYLGSDWKVVRDDIRILPNWFMKKEDALCTYQDKEIFDIGTLKNIVVSEKVKFTGTDSAKVCHPYLANEDK